VGRLKTTIYARMEEMSFRSGAAVFAGVLAAAGVAITLAVGPGGGPSPTLPSAAPASGPSPGAAARSVAPPPPAPAARARRAFGHAAAQPDGHPRTRDPGRKLSVTSPGDRGGDPAGPGIVSRRPQDSPASAPDAGPAPGRPALLLERALGLEPSSDGRSAGAVVLAPIKTPPLLG
jgi:hypothetical protein